MIKRKVEQLDGVIDETEKNYTSNTMDRVFGNIKVPFFGVRGPLIHTPDHFPSSVKWFLFLPFLQKKQQKFVSVIPQMPAWVEPEPLGVDKIFGKQLAQKGPDGKGKGPEVAQDSQQ